MKERGFEYSYSEEVPLHILFKAKKNLDNYPSDEDEYYDEDGNLTVEYIEQILDDVKIIEEGVRDPRVKKIALQTLSSLSYDDINPRVSDFALQLLHRHLDYVLEPNLSFSDDAVEMRATVLHALSYRKGVLSEQEIDQIVRVLFDQLKQAIAEKTLNIMFPLCQELIDIAPNNTKQEIIQLINDEVTRQGVTSHLFARCFVLLEPTELKSFAEKLLMNEIGLYGIDPEETLDNWRDSAGKKFFEQSTMINQNLKVMKSIEETSPGICKFLNQYYRIFDFGRYPAELLIKQREQHELNIPYGVVVQPRSDHNGAFYSKDSVFAKLYEQVKDTHAIRFFETEDKLGILRLLHRVTRRAGGRKISFAILGGHGSINNITFGSWGKRNAFNTKDSDDSRADVSRFFEEDATIILQSCSTGKDKGVAEKINQTLGLRVVAPDLDTNLQSIKVEKHGEGLIFHVVYEGGPNVTKTFESKERSSK